MISDAWHDDDASKLHMRLSNGLGRGKGRVLYFLARPALTHGASVQREAAALLSLRKKKLMLFRVCMRQGLVRADQRAALFWLCSATYELAKLVEKPLQVYLEPGTDVDAMEARLRDFDRAPKKNLNRRQRESAGVWLQRSL